MRRIFHLVGFFAVAWTVFQTAPLVVAENLPLYIGTGSSEIYLSQFDTEKGTLTDPVMVAETPRPTFIWIHPATNSLYSICEVGRRSAKESAAIVAWSIGDDGKLTKRSQQDAGGDGPCFVAVSKSGHWATIANYGGGSVSLFPVADDGTVEPASSTIQHVGSSVNQRRQKEPHAHSSRFDPTGKRIVAADLGTDKVYIYDIGNDGSLKPSTPTAIDCPKGSGPRHVAFSPDEKYLLVLGELTGTITSVRYAPPKIELIETVSTMAQDAAADAPRGSAEILFHPNGKWVYASNRGPNEIAVFNYESTTGKVRRTSAVSSGGKHPRNFRISPDGRYLLCANQNTNNVVVFKIDSTNGSLTKTSVDLSVKKPMCLKFLRTL